MLNIPLRKKLILSIASIIVTSLVGYLALKNIDVSPETQAHLVEVIVYAITIIATFFNIGQGIADIGKEKGGPK